MDEKLEEKKETKGINLFKLLQNIALVGLFIMVGIGALIGAGLLDQNIVTIQWSVIVTLVFIGILLALPWAKYLEQKEYKVVSIVFLSLSLVCVILWIISTFVVCAHMEAGTVSVGLVNLLRITLIISLQLIVSTIIGSYVIKYKEKYIPFQVITYLSFIFFDFYLTALLVGVTTAGGDFSIRESFKTLLFSRGMLSALVLSFSYIIASIAIVWGSKRRSLRNRMLSPRNRLRRDTGLLDVYEEEEEKQPEAPDTEKQLEKLKTMLDKNLISQEEYEAKRKEIIDKM